MGIGNKLFYQRLFETAPGLYLVLDTALNIAAVSNAYLHATNTNREQINGKYLFDIFPDNPDDPAADGVSNLLASLRYVIRHGKPHKMELQKYDVRREDGTFEERWWRPLNTPVLNDDGVVEYVIHQVEDVTEMKRLRAEEIVQRRNLHESNRLLQEEMKERKRTEDQILTIFEAAPDAIIVIDKNGAIVNWNIMATQLFGWSAEEITGQRIIDHIIPAKYETVLEQGLQHFLRTGKSHVLNKTIEIKAIKKNKTEFDVAIRIAAVRSKDDYLFVGFLRDITEQKKSEIKFKGLLESAPDAMIITDDKGDIVLVNQQAVSMFGYEKNEINGKRVEMLVPDELKQLHAENREGYYHDPKVREMGAGLELYAVHKNGAKFPVEISLSPLHTADGLLVAAAVRDITERKRSEEALLELNKELESFTYSVSHDLRSPLRIIDGYADILVTDYSSVMNEEGHQFLEVIKQNAQKMGQLIDDLLNLSRAGRKELSVFTVNMNQLVKPIIDEQLMVSGIEAKIISEKLEPAVCDSNLIKQVWQNLINNAIKYSSKTKEPIVHIESERNNHEVIYSVSDNGAGFDMKYADKLFGVFQRLHKATEFSGTGVGLALVKRIVNKHGGRVWAESITGKGARFFFSLPV